MKKNVSKIIALALILVQLVVLMSIGVSATTFNGAENSTMTIKQTDASLMNIDGSVTTNEAWNNVAWSSVSQKYGGTANSSFRFKAMWAKNDTVYYLYLLIDVTDATVTTATGYNWANDSIRVLVDQNNTMTSGTKIENGSLSVDAGKYNNTLLWAQRSASGFFAYNNKSGTYKVKEKGDSTGYYVEASIKLGVAIANNTQMKMNILVQDGDYVSDNSINNAQMFWSASATAWDGGKKDAVYVDHAGTITYSTDMISNNVDNTLIGSVAYVYQTSADKVTIDGQVGATEAWNSVAWNTQNYKLGSDTTITAFQFKAMWAKDTTKAYLYLLIDVTDATVTTATAYNWANDSLQVLLDQDCSMANGIKHQDGTVAISNRYNTTVLWAQRSAAGFGSYNNQSGTYKVSEKAQNGYYVEAKITLTNFDYVKDGAKMRMNLLLQDGDNNSSYAQRLWSFDATAWSSGKTDKTYTDHTGTLVFTNEEAYVPSDSIEVNAVQTTSIAGSTTYDARFVANVDTTALANADKINFIITCTYVENEVEKKVTKTVSVNTVYESFLAGQNKIDAENGEAFALLLVTNIPSSLTVTFKIIPQIVYKDTTVATGLAATCVLPKA